MRAHKLQVWIIVGVTAASVLAAVPAVLPLPIWDFLGALADYPARRMPPPALFGWAFLLPLVVTLELATNRERAELHAGLTAEVRGGHAAVSQGEAAVLAHPKLRRVHRLLCARAFGWRAYVAVGHLHQLQLDLAYERCRLARQVGRVPAASPSALRQDIQALRRSISAPVEATP